MRILSCSESPTKLVLTGVADTVSYIGGEDKLGLTPTGMPRPLSGTQAGMSDQLLR